MLLAGTIPWGGFGPLPGVGALNLRVGTRVPWAILPMAGYLWAYWQYIGGPDLWDSGVDASFLAAAAASMALAFATARAYRAVRRYRATG